MGIIDGLRDVADGIGKVVEGIGKIILGALELALMAVILPIAGIYIIAKEIFNYARRKYRELKERRPKTKPAGTGGLNGKALAKALAGAARTIGEEISLSELEKEEAIKDIEKIEEMLESEEIDGMQYMDGKNELGEDDILDAEFFKSTSVDSSSKDKYLYRPFKK